MRHRVCLCVLIVFNLIILQQASFAEEPTRPKASFINSQTVRQWQVDQRDIVLVDVREKKEFDAGHIEGAISMPYYQVEKSLNQFKKGNQPLYIFYCTYSAWRAPYAANVLADYGYQNTFVLEGGVSAWNAGGQVIYATNQNQEPAVIPYGKNDPKILNHPQDKVYDQKIDLTLDELKQFDGKDGRLAYVAVKGVIYDLTQSRLWRGGEHVSSKGKAWAGRDLTKVIAKSPHGYKVLKNFPVVGRLVNDKRK